MVPDEFVEMAQTYPLLSKLDPGQLRKLLPLAEKKQFPAGRLIFVDGDKSAFLYLIVSGEVALEMPLENRNVRVQTLHRGEAMGWSALTTDTVTHFQARALSSVSTVAFAGERLREACDRDPEMGYALMKGLFELLTERLDATRLQLLREHA